MRKGQTWLFEQKPCIMAGSAVGAIYEKEGAMPQAFDYFFDDMRAGESSFELAERKFLEKACQITLNKAGIKAEELDCFLAGDLMNQIISSSYTARQLGCPYLGQFGACSTSAQTLLLGAAMLNSGYAKQVLCATVSNNGSAEKQFRFPNEYGIQKPDTTQLTVSAAGAGLLAAVGSQVKITSATVGRVQDYGITDGFNLGAAMAPAACDTLLRHLHDLNRQTDFYDIILTGDLGRVGRGCLLDLLRQAGQSFQESRLLDGGVLIYNKEQEVFSGGSGCGCSASVLYGHFLRLLQQGEIARLLFIATGALMSPVSLQQNESIPCIAHAVAIERE